MASSSSSSSRARPLTRSLRCGVGALALLVAACSGQEIHTGLTEREANEIVAVLGTAGVTASKDAGEKETWSVSVPQGDFAKAVEVLRANGLPRENFESLGTVFKKEGFTSSPLSERARLIYGLSQELSRTISDIDGVVQARVHVTMPEPHPLSREAAPASASVFVKYRPGFDLRNQTGAIKSLVTNGVEGLTYDRVSVVMLPARPLPVPAEAGWSGIAGTVAAVLAGLAALIAAVVLARTLPGRLRKRRAAGTAVTPTHLG
ncbi:type III secretion apparatus lipoprotein, YscJ/HrcJ family [Sphingomonas guangdongensis]|uniref:Lipoprotein n=1 Tax=Sphingomonas guangdongensis TaxID=1141890 RepID=A0A285QX68_9SPHN|nr:type III secretion apparatus lipoprotein, YscJ/HrcJ family [Sphingomonas guangdongensis]